MTSAQPITGTNLDVRLRADTDHEVLIRPVSGDAGDAAGGTWFRLFDAWIDSGVWFKLSNAAKNVIALLAKMCPRHPYSPLCETTISFLAITTGHTERTVLEALAELERFQCLERLGKPGRKSVYRLLTPRAAAPPRHPRPVEHPCSTGQGCAAAPELRARQTNQTKERREERSKPNQTKEAREGEVWSGWSEPGLWAEDAAERGDVLGLLMSLGVWEYAATPLAAHPALSCRRVLRTMAEIRVDPATKNPPMRLATFLAKQLGITLPQAPSKKRDQADRLAQLKAWGDQRVAAKGVRS